MPTEMKTIKIYVRLPPERMDGIKELAKEVGIPYTQFGGLLLWMGYQAYLRQLHPERAFSIDQLIEIGRKANEEKYPSS